MYYKIILLMTLCGVAINALVDGDLDPTFGTGGIVSIPAANVGAGTAYGRSIVVQRDGKIVVCVWGDLGGLILLVRLTTTGAIDTTFNAGGAIPGVANVSTDVTFMAFVGGMALDAQDNIVLVGSDVNQTGDLYVARYIGTGALAGTLDTTFNPGGAIPGSLTTNIGTYQAADCAIDSQGRIVVNALDNNMGAAAYVVRVLSDGTLDATFGVGGVVTITDPTYFLYPSAIKVTSTDTIVTSITGLNQVSLDESILVYQLSSTDGSLIAPFNPFVVSFVAPPALDSAYVPFYTCLSVGKGLIVGSSNNFYLYGTVNLFTLVPMLSLPNLYLSYFGIKGFTSTGATASGFGYQGQFVTALTPANNLLPFNDGQTDVLATYKTPYTGRLIQLNDGKFIAVGYDTTGLGFITRLTSNGAFDTTFNGSGTPLPGVIPTSIANTAALKFYLDSSVQSNGYILATGGIGLASPVAGPNSTDILIARYFTETGVVCPVAIEEQLNSIGGGLSCAIITKYAAAGSTAAACACTPISNTAHACNRQ